MSSPSRCRPTLLAWNPGRAHAAVAPLRAALGILLAALPSAAAPIVASTSPADLAVGVPLDANITVTFAALVKGASIHPGVIQVSTNQRGPISGAFSWSGPLKRISFDPDEDFRAGERVQVTVTRDVTDPGGNPLPGGHSFQFAAWTAPVDNGAFVRSPTGSAIGSIPLSATPGDLDGDRIPEMIWSNTVPDSLTILSVDGQGQLPPFASLPTSLLPRQSVVTDLDADGFPDIVVATSSDFVDVFRGQPGGGFLLDTYPVPVGVTPYSVFVADLDADGDLDAVTANFNGHDISVLRNQGDGSFGPVTNYSAGAGADSPRYVDGSDLDGDGDIDLAVCNGYSYDVSILLNDGNAGFSAQPLIPVGESPNFLEIRDYDGDAVADVVTINSIGENLTFLRGNGDGTFLSAVNFDIGGSFPFGITSVDMDGDGDLDVVVPVRGLDGWRTMWNDGAGGFTQGALQTGGLHCHSIGAADWDDDGDIDVVAGYAISQDAYYYEHAPTPALVSTFPAKNVTGVAVQDPIIVTFNTPMDPSTLVALPSPFQVTGSQSGPHAVSAAWNGSPSSVLLTPTRPFVPGEIVTVTMKGGGVLLSADGVAYAGHAVSFMTEGAPAPVSFGAQAVALPGSDPVAVAAADLDADGISDLVVANYLSADVTVLLSGGGLPAVSASVAVGTGPADVWMSDLDGDGAVDVAVANLVGGTVSILLNDGSGSLIAQPALSFGSAPFALSGGDFDRDGDADIAVAGLGPDVVEIFWNDGQAAFPTSSSIAVTGAPLDLAAADFDNDGDLDLVSVDGGASRMEVFHYDQVAGFSAVGTFSTGSVPVATFPWDTDGDGWVDLVSSDYSGAGISVLRNLGDGASFAPAFNLPSGQQPHGLWAGDVTGDGALDLITANSGDGTVTVFGNQGGGVYNAGSAVTVGTTPYGLVGGDWNGDGRIDLAVINRTSGSLSLLLSGGVSETPAGAGPRDGLLAVAPNPFREAVQLRMSRARPGPALLQIVDVRGREVRRIHDGPLGAGEHVFRWDGRDPGGHPVAAGVYFLRVSGPGGSESRKLLRLK